MFRRWGFCGWSFLPSNDEVLAVEDLTNDARRVFSSCFRLSRGCQVVPRPESAWVACQGKRRARDSLSNDLTITTLFALPPTAWLPDVANACLGSHEL